MWKLRWDQQQKYRLLNGRVLHVHIEVVRDTEWGQLSQPSMRVLAAFGADLEALRSRGQVRA